jgi:hypothetical protein
MTHSLLRKIIDEVIAESSPARRAATRSQLTQAHLDDTEGAPPVSKSGRVDILAQIAQLGYSLAGETAVEGPHREPDTEDRGRDQHI